MKKLPQIRRNANKASNKSNKPKQNIKQHLSKVSYATAHWNYKALTIFLVVTGSLIAIGTSWFWYKDIHMTAERRFWIAINNSMATPSAVRTLTEGGSGNQVVQDYRFYYSPEKVLKNKVAYTERDATINTYVETEGIVYYPQDQFLRYNAFSSRQDEASSVDINELLGVWASQETADEEQDKLSYQSELVTLAIFGNFDSNFRHSILHDMKTQEVYGDVSVGAEDRADGVDVLNYTVTIKLKAYVTLLNNAFVRAGYDEFPPLDPSNYEDDATVPANITIRKKDNVIVGINFGGRQEVYSNYGVVNTLTRPDAVLTVPELQQKVQSKLQP